MYNWTALSSGKKNNGHRNGAANVCLWDIQCSCVLWRSYILSILVLSISNDFDFISIERLVVRNCVTGSRSVCVCVCVCKHVSYPYAFYLWVYKPVQNFARSVFGELHEYVAVLECSLFVPDVGATAGLTDWFLGDPDAWLKSSLSLYVNKTWNFIRTSQLLGF